LVELVPHQRAHLTVHALRCYWIWVRSWVGYGAGPEETVGGYGASDRQRTALRVGGYGAGVPHTP